MSDLTGFTLFKTGRGWQLSTRVKESADGWSIRIVSDEVAQAVFDKVAEFENPPTPQRKITTMVRGAP